MNLGPENKVETKRNSRIKKSKTVEKPRPKKETPTGLDALADQEAKMISMSSL